MYDLVIRKGTVIDGTGATGYVADIAIKDGKIARIAHSIAEKAAETIEADGLIVSPGFVDMHSHSDQRCLFNNTASNYLEQGITTEVMGQCGIAVVPYDESYETEIRTLGVSVPEEKLAAFRAIKNVGDFLDMVDRYGNGTNVAVLLA
ncbi:amidohydrolase family protein, partial [Desulfovibrio sp. OttesenSCG-928-I05]|nr:amidohydrolase family protein [Desulfovibrio sp. OttesenSCG-928-I05]